MRPCPGLAALIAIAWAPGGALAQQLVPVLERGAPMRLVVVSTAAAAPGDEPCTIRRDVDRRTTLSTTCMTCHDGSRAGAADARVGHKFGIDYAVARTKPGSGLRVDPEGFSTVVVLQLGQVGCLSCHSPSSTLPAHLAAPTSGPVNGRLCVACHVH